MKLLILLASNRQTLNNQSKYSMNTTPVLEDNPGDGVGIRAIEDIAGAWVHTSLFFAHYIALTEKILLAECLHRCRERE